MDKPLKVFDGYDRDFHVGLTGGVEELDNHSRYFAVRDTRVFYGLDHFTGYAERCGLCCLSLDTGDTVDLYIAFLELGATSRGLPTTEPVR